MAKQLKTKYPADREKQSQAFANGEVSTQLFTTHPRLIITVGGGHSPEVITDMENAIDEVLKHHGK